MRKMARNSYVMAHNTKKMEYRDQYSYSYFIKKELAAFEYIMRHLTENIDNALDLYYGNQRDWKKFLEIEDDKPRELTFGSKCALIRSFIKSPYVRELISIYGFKSVYQTYKEIIEFHFVRCGLDEFREHARNLNYDRTVKDREIFGEEFWKDSDPMIIFFDSMNESYI